METEAQRETHPLKITVFVKDTYLNPGTCRVRMR